MNSTALPLYNTSDKDFLEFMAKSYFSKRHDLNFDLHDKLTLKATLYQLKCLKKGLKPEYTIDEMVINGLKAQE